jgi:hypothetical protein
MIDLGTLTLARGSHRARSEGVCLLEAVAWFAGEEHTAHPACVSPVLAAFGRSLNDILPAAERQELVPLIPLLPGTARDGHDETRGYLALDWLIRTYTPAWLDLAGLTGEAQALRDLRRIVDQAAVQSAGPAVDAAGAAAWDAAASTRDAAGAATWDAARAATRDAAWATAWDVTRAATWAAARAAARDAAWDATWAALAPTVAVLQEAAIQLYRDMMAPATQGVR